MPQLSLISSVQVGRKDALGGEGYNNTSCPQGSLFYTETELETPWVIIKKPWKKSALQAPKIFQGI